MLKKNTELLIDPKNPFKEDCLHRQDIAENLTQLVRTITQPFVLSINAPWGMGKTTFIKMWQAKLQNEGHPCIYFNAWETDFSADPLISFIGEIESHIETNVLLPDNKSELKKQFNKLKKIGADVLKKATPLVLRLGTAGAINNIDEVKALLSFDPSAGKTVADFMAKLSEEKIKNYKGEKRAIKNFKENLQKLASIISTDSRLKPPLLFFIDELDRCRPSYAIELLEKIKHMFNVDGIVFILALDRQQLAHSVKSLYGAGMDAEGYLRRFIDLDFQLPIPSPEDYCLYLSQKFNFDEIFGRRHDGQDEKKSILIIFSRLSEAFRLTLRVQEQCFTQLNIILRTTARDHHLYPYFFPFLIALKASDSFLYQRFVDQEITPKQVMEYLQKSKAGKDLLQEPYGAAIEAYLISSFDTSQEEVEQKMERYRNSQNKREQTVLRVLDDIRLNGIGALEYLIKKIQMSERFNP